MSSATVVVTVLAVVALTMAGRADDQRKPAVSRQLVADARAQLQVDPELGLLLAREAYTAAPSEDAEAVLRKAATDSHIRTTLGGSSTQIRFRATDSLTGAVFGPDGKHVVTSNTSAALQVRTWDDPWAWRGKIAFSSDGRRVASGSSDGTVRIRNTADDDQPTVLDSSESLSGWHGAVGAVVDLFLVRGRVEAWPGCRVDLGDGLLELIFLVDDLAGAGPCCCGGKRRRRTAFEQVANEVTQVGADPPGGDDGVPEGADAFDDPDGGEDGVGDLGWPRASHPVRCRSTIWTAHAFDTMATWLWDRCGRRAAGHNHPRGPNGRTRDVRASAAESPPILAHADERTPE
ncbi:WD40 repeat domain-containing protein [Streptomyces sp. MN03-5084-2B]|nr:WD40 repeat domain-containing protein [Streptomyces sp. MN03-5084-2B]